MSDEKNKKVEVTRETETDNDGNTSTREKITKEEKNVPEVKKKDDDVEVKEEITTVTETHDED